MRQLILEEWVSLDGFAADREGGLDFFPTTEENKFADQRQLEFLRSVDTMLIGRKTYEMFADYWPKTGTDKEIIADALNGLNKYVVSSTLKEAPWGDWPAGEILSGDAVGTIRELKAAAGKDIVLWGSISLAQTLLKAGLIDRVRLSICPVILGGGRSLFPDLESWKKLKLRDSRSFETGVLWAEYERT